MVSRVRLVLPCLLLVAAALCGCHGAPPPAQPQVNIVPTPPPAKDPTPVPPTPPAPSKVTEAVNALLSQPGSSPFPKGTHLKSAVVTDGVAVLDFSKEFNALGNSGDSVESQAQKALQAALAAIPEVQKMRVTVEGKPYDSQVTDWITPFPVRNDTTKAGGGQ